MVGLILGGLIGGPTGRIVGAGIGGVAGGIIGYKMDRQIKELKEQKIVDHRPDATKRSVDGSAGGEFADEPNISTTASGNGLVEKLEVSA